LLSEESKREMRRVQWLGEGLVDDQCLGFATWKVKDWRVYGHAGGFQGFSTHFAFDPNRQIGIAVLTNAIDGPARTLVTGALSVINKFIVD
jgi:D-alanyl-D-alanine carboxypeptidase